MGCGPRCSGCPLEHSGKGFTQIEIGPRYERNRLLLVGEASGEAEARESLPFRPYAQSGSLLVDSMKAVGMGKGDVALTNVIRCRPPGDWLEGAPWTSGAIAHCTREYLIPTVQHLAPRAILALGGTAMRTLTPIHRNPDGKVNSKSGLEYMRGYVQNGQGAAEGVPVLSTFHPAFLRRGKPNYAPLLQRDLTRALKVAQNRLTRGRDWATDPYTLPLRYATAPTLAEAWAAYRAIDPELPIFFDIETPRTTREDEDDRTSFADRDINLFQFTQRAGEGMAIPYREEFREVVKAIMALPNLKVGHNNFVFDLEVMAANDIVVNGEIDDTMVMWGRFHPDLPANLQSVAGFFSFPFPWKHMNESDQAFYGIADVDALAWIYPRLREAMERIDVWEAYKRYFRRFWPILRDMAHRGLPIDEARRVELGRVVEESEREKMAEIQGLVPAEVLSVKHKAGLKRAPKDTTGYVEIDVKLEKEEKCVCLKKSRPSCAICAGTGIIASGTVMRRWTQPVEFNPNSHLQVKKYMKFMKHSVPKHAKRTDAATGEASETTEVKELERLADKTKDPIYAKLIELRQLSKIAGTYVDGWRPSQDGRLHTTFTYRPATWQTSSRQPNIQNGLKRGRSMGQKARAKAFNAMQRAEPGHLLVNFDFKSFHAQTTACEASLADYLRLAKIDVHSFNACHFVRHSERHNLLSMSDADLKAFFGELKRSPAIWTNGMTFKEIRDGKTKSAGLGIGFGMRGKKLYQMYQEDFTSIKEAEAIWNLIMVDLFPGLLKWQERVKRQAAPPTVWNPEGEGMLRSKYGAIRRFDDVFRFNRKTQRYDGGDQGEAAIAFLPAANAFGMIREALILMDDEGLLERFELVNSVHDSLVFHPRVEDVDKCIAAVIPIMQAPSKVLVYPISPRGLDVEAECAVGESLAEMKEVKCA